MTEESSFPVVTDFLTKIAASTEAIYLGIDPGRTGAIALLCGQRMALVDMPVIVFKTKKTRNNSAKVFKKTGKKTRTVLSEVVNFDFAAICAFFKLLRPHKARIKVALEAVPTSLGPGRHHAEIMLNRAYAMWPLFLYSKGYAVEEIRPNDWKQRMGLTGKPKEASRLKALAMFPKADIQLKKHVDRAEALLMAECCRRLQGGTR